MANLNLNYYYGNEAEQYSFFRIPKALSTDHRYSGLSLEAKFLYGLLLDRMGLSAQKGWMDREGRIYIYFRLEEIKEQIGCGHNKAVKLLSELEEIGLIERQRMGMGRPTRIYVKNFNLPLESPEKRSSTPTERPSAPFTPQIETDTDTSSVKHTFTPVQASETHMPPFEVVEQPAPKFPRAPKTPVNPVSRPMPQEQPAAPAPEQPRTDSFCQNEQAKTSRFGTSRLPVLGSHDFPKSEGIIMKNKTERNNTESSSINPYPGTINSSYSCRSKERMRMDEMERYRSRIRENIEYDRLLEDYPLNEETLEGYVEMMAEACCTRRDFVHIGGNDIPSGAVKKRFLKLNREHIVYVFDCMNENTTLVRNIKAYTLAALYNAPLTMSAYYAARVNHDLYGSVS